MLMFYEIIREGKSTHGRVPPLPMAKDSLYKGNPLWVVDVDSVEVIQALTQRNDITISSRTCNYPFTVGTITIHKNPDSHA